MKKILLTALVAVVSVSGFSQKKAKALEGKIIFELTYEELPEMFEPYRAMMPKESVTYVKGSKMRMEQSVMGTVTVNVVDNEKKTGFMLMDQFGEKTAYTMSEKNLEEEKVPADQFEYKYLDETKEIAGYKCQKVEITNKKENTTDVAWVTEEIKSTTKAYPGLKGYAMELTVHAPNEIVISMKVKTIEKMKIDNSFFEIPKEYTVKTMDELQNQLKNMPKNSDE